MKEPTQNSWMEVNLFDFSATIYDKKVDVRFFKRFRSEQIFPNLDALKHQISLDENAIRTYFQSVTV